MATIYFQKFVTSKSVAKSIDIGPNQYTRIINEQMCASSYKQRLWNMDHARYVVSGMMWIGSLHHKSDGVDDTSGQLRTVHHDIVETFVYPYRYFDRRVVIRQQASPSLGRPCTERISFPSKWMLRAPARPLAYSDGQNIYCRCVIYNVGTGGRTGFGCVSARYRAVGRQRPKDLYEYCSSGTHPGAVQPTLDGHT